MFKIPSSSQYIIVKARYIFFKKSLNETNKKILYHFSMSQPPEKTSLLGDKEHHCQNLKLKTLYHKALP